MPREDLDYLWDDKASQIHEETFNKIYESEMEKYNEQKPYNWYREEAHDLAINLAEDAVDEYLIKKRRLSLI